ncbi:ester cyclase [Rhizohabitans arisaemae]|uniref:ester cyclase n=1 Tax=Rhizohabitans arisaemae TaxID=2720610 RepID=UPI0024B091C5|nr:ester cyclase [Rhizohabitans arisaemae]
MDSTQEANKAIARDFWAAGKGLTDGQDPSLYYSEDYYNHASPPGAPQGLDNVRNLGRLFRRIWPDHTIEIEHIVAEGELVAFFGRFVATHQAEMFGIPPTGKQVSFPVAHMLRIRDGKILEHWAVRDDLKLMRQLGGTEEVGGVMWQERQKAGE